MEEVRRFFKKNKKAKNQRFFHFNFFKKNRKAIVTDYLPWLIIGLALLAIIFIAILLLKDKGVSFIDYIKNLFRGRGG